MFGRPFQRIVLITALAAGLSGIATTAAGAAAATTPEEKAFVAQGDLICKAVNIRLAEKAKDYERAVLLRRQAAHTVRQAVAKPADVAAFVAEVALPEMRTQIDQLGRLKAPKSQATAFATAMKEANRAYDVVKAKPAEASFTNPFQSFGKQLKALGFNDCGQTVSGTDKAK